MVAARQAAAKRAGRSLGTAVLLVVLLMGVSCLEIVSAEQGNATQDVKADDVAEGVATIEAEKKQEAGGPTKAEAESKPQAIPAGKSQAAPTSGPSPSPPPSRSPQVAEVIKLQVGGEEVSSETEEEVDYDEKLAQIKQNLANKASERAAKLREAKEWVQKKMASSKIKTRQQRTGKEEL